VEWIKRTNPWYRRKWWALSSFMILMCKLSWTMGLLAICIANFVICFWNHIESTMFHLLPIWHKI
jgi:hypothetical protein